MQSTIQPSMAKRYFVYLEKYLMWQSSSKEEDRYTFRTIQREHWSIGM